LVDPFDAGAPLTPDACAALVERAVGQRVPLTDAAFAAVSKRQLLARMLMNLKGIYWRRKDWSRAAGVGDRLLVLDPTAAGERRDRGVALVHLATFCGVADWNYLVEQPDARDGEQVRRQIRARLSSPSSTRAGGWRCVKGGQNVGHSVGILCPTRASGSGRMGNAGNVSWALPPCRRRLAGARGAKARRLVDDPVDGRGPLERRASGHHHQLRLPRAVPGRDRRRGVGAGVHLEPDAVPSCTACSGSGPPSAC
jgi:hypothetical protein